MEKYFDFKGRAPRTEYWTMYGLVIISSVIAVLAMMFLPEVLAGLAAIVWIVGALWAQLATTVRRLRDMDQSPWLASLILVPYISLIFSIVVGCSV